MNEEEKSLFEALIASLGSRGVRARIAANQLETTDAKFVFLHLLKVHPTCGIFWGDGDARIECKQYSITVE